MYIVKQGGRTDYNYKELFLDSQAELQSIDTNTLCPGSIAYIIASGDVYILNSSKTWVIQ